VLGAEEVPGATPLEVHPLALAAWERLARWWPEPAAQAGSMRRM
jgi:hypothetical protein